MVWALQNVLFPLAVPVFLLVGVPVAVWVERRGAAFIQDRVGPNRITIFGWRNAGLLQPIADALKLLVKEEFLPARADKVLYFLAPACSMIPALLTFAVIPFGDTLVLGKYAIPLQVADLNVGILFLFAVASLGVYGIVLGGWAPDNKYTLLGGLRSSAQMISYEISMGLSVIGILILFESVRLNDIVRLQGDLLFGFLPRWGIVVQPLGFLLFFVAALAETNRIPFDLPEAEAEIVAGYHLEYSSFKFSMFFMAEYVNMLVASGVITSLFLGGWQIPWVSTATLVSWLGFGTAWLGPVLAALLQIGVFVIKVWFLMWLFVWLRWTLPRFRYDQLMGLGWRVMLPLALLNLAVTAVVFVLMVQLGVK
jgi:NADH-quinone oxidoreductase subunit H